MCLIFCKPCWFEANGKNPVFVYPYKNRVLVFLHGFQACQFGINCYNSDNLLVLRFHKRISVLLLLTKVLGQIVLDVGAVICWMAKFWINLCPFAFGKR